MSRAQDLAKKFHEAYERLAQFGYETRRESAKPWEEVPENNRRLMEAVCEELLGAARCAQVEAELAQAKTERETYRNYYLHYEEKFTTAESEVTKLKELSAKYRAAKEHYEAEEREYSRRIDACGDMGSTAGISDLGVTVAEREMKKCKEELFKAAAALTPSREADNG
jgi:DNA repair ATPase RecN